MDNKNEPVKMTGKVSIKKDNEYKKFLKLFFTGNFSEALSSAFTNVLVPYTKDAICKTSNNIINSWVNGDKVANTPQSGVSRVSYWNGQSSIVRQQNPQPTIKQSNNIYNVGTLYFEDRGDAEEVLLKLKENVETYHLASVADLYELSGEKFTYTDYKYGWRNLDSAHVVRTLDGKYIIDLPKIMPLE